MPNKVPFTTFNFKVLLTFPGAPLEAGAVCRGEFSECDGLEMTMAPKTIREGGNNGRPIHLVGPISYGQLTLKRGMTENAALWSWFELTQRRHELRAQGKILLLGPDREPQVRFALSGCLPIKIKAPALSAKDGLIAIEEMQLAYETLRLETGPDIGNLAAGPTA